MSEVEYRRAKAAQAMSWIWWYNSAGNRIRPRSGRTPNSNRAIGMPLAMLFFEPQNTATTSSSRRPSRAPRSLSGTPQKSENRRFEIAR